MPDVLNIDAPNSIEKLVSNDACIPDTHTRDCPDTSNMFKIVNDSLCVQSCTAPHTAVTDSDVKCVSPASFSYCTVLYCTVLYCALSNLVVIRFRSRTHLTLTAQIVLFFSYTNIIEITITLFCRMQLSVQYTITTEEYFKPLIFQNIYVLVNVNK